MQLLTFVKIFHLLGLIMGLGGAVLLDFTVLTQGVLRPISRYTLHQTNVLSRVVTLGLVLLWITGIVLIWLNYQLKPEYITNPKLWAKIVIVVGLTLNGILIHHKVLPAVKQKVGERLFEGMRVKSIAILTFVGAVSFTSWVFPMVLGKASELNYVTPMSYILTAYAGTLLVVWLALFVGAGSIAKMQNFIIFFATKTALTNEDWEAMQPAMQNSVDSLRLTSQTMQTELNRSLNKLRDIIHTKEQQEASRKRLA